MLVLLQRRNAIVQFMTRCLSAQQFDAAVLDLIRVARRAKSHPRKSQRGEKVVLIMRALSFSRISSPSTDISP